MLEPLPLGLIPEVQAGEMHGNVSPSGIRCRMGGVISPARLGADGCAGVSPSLVTHRRHFEVVQVTKTTYPLHVFFDWKIGTSFEDAPYVGFRHFLRMVYDADVHESIWVTLKFGFWTILIEMVLGITLALLLEKPIRADQSSEPFSSSR